MAERDPTFWDYVKGAFYARRRVRILGDVPVNVLGLLTFAVAGLVNPGIWLVGAGIEVWYLSWLSQNERFRNLVRSERLVVSTLTFMQRLQAVVARMGPDGRKRFEQLEQKCAVVRDLASAQASAAVPRIDQMQEDGLNSLRMIHARLLLSRELLVAHRRESSLQELRSRITDSERRIAEATSEAMKRSLDSNLEILKKRVQHHEAAKENLEVIDAELERIENQVDLLREEVTVSRDPTALSARIDAVAGTIGEASQFLKMNEELLGDLGGEGDVPGVPPVAARPRSKTAG